MSRSNEDFNAIVRRLWTIMVREKLGNEDALEVIGRLHISLAMMVTGGDPRAAARAIEADCAAIVAGLLDPATRVQSVIHAKSDEPEPSAEAIPPPPRPRRRARHG